MTSPKSCTFERLVLLCKQPLVVWVSMASPRPLLPVASRCTNGRYGIITGHRCGNHLERQLSRYATARFPWG